MKGTRIIVNILWSGILWCIISISCTRSEHRAKTQMDTYMQYYALMIDSISKNPSCVCTETFRQMAATTDSVVYYH